MKKFKERIFHIIQIGDKSDIPSRVFDIFIVLVIFINLFATFFETFEESIPYQGILDWIELVTIIIFTVEYILRLWTADLLYPDKKRMAATIAFIFSFYGLVDLITFFPFYLPMVIPSGVVAFRVFRVIRIFKLFKINTNYDAFNVIVDVINEKKNQILSSFCLILILMIASSLCMYSLEHEAQPENFKNAFSGIWWSVSTVLTVGYGDIYPVTTMGKVMAIVISFLGVGIVAIPTGIISAGFVEQYTKVKPGKDVLNGEIINNLTEKIIGEDNVWVGKAIKDLDISKSQLIVLIQRNNRTIVPNGLTIIKKDDHIVMYTKHKD